MTLKVTDICDYVSMSIYSRVNAYFSYLETDVDPAKGLNVAAFVCAGNEINLVFCPRYMGTKPRKSTYKALGLHCEGRFIGYKRSSSSTSYSLSSLSQPPSSSMSYQTSTPSPLPFSQLSSMLAISYCLCIIKL